MCSKKTENIRFLIKPRERVMRAQVRQKDEIHSLIVNLGMHDNFRSKVKKGVRKVWTPLSRITTVCLKHNQ